MKFRKNSKFFIVFFLTITLIIFLIEFGILPASQNFEGNLLVKSFSFTCNESDRLFLKDVRNLQEITLSGIQKFTLTGTINNPSNSNLKGLDKVEIELSHENSTLTITSPKDFTLEELRLQEKNHIRNLKYASFTNQLSFTLKPESQSPTFSFNPSSQSIKITLSGYKILNASLASDDMPLEFELTTTEFQLQPKNSIDVILNLPKESDQPVFWREIKVADVQFDRLINGGRNIRDNRSESTILSGNFRMAKQELKLEENQFLLVEKPGIESLNQIEIISSDSTQSLELKTTGENLKISEPFNGLEVSVSGNTNSLQVGLNPRLPIAKIQGSILSRFVANEVVVAIISFSAGLVVSLLSWLFDNFPKSSSPSISISIEQKNR